MRKPARSDPKLRSYWASPKSPACANWKSTAASSRRSARATRASMRKPLRGRDVWVVVETNLEGFVTGGSLELLSRADQLATHLGGAVIASGFGASMRKHAGVLARYGADRVVIVESPALESYTP